MASSPERPPGEDQLIGIDLGGTAIKLARCDEQGTVLAEAEVATPQPAMPGAVCVALAEAVHLVLADLVLGQLVEQVAQGVGTDLAEALGRQLEAALLLLDQPRVLEHLGELGETLERPGGVVAHQVAHSVHVGLGERTRVGGVAEQVLELVELAQFLHRLHRLTHAHRVLALEVVALTPVHLGEHALQVLAELVHLPAQVHVLEELVAELLEL
jgi:predicted NBD/HSP70 family sugar kinase